MDGDVFTSVSVNAGSGNYGPAKISANILHIRFRITFIRLCINIKPMFIVSVTDSFCFFKEGPIFFPISLRSAVRKEIRK